MSNMIALWQKAWIHPNLSQLATVVVVRGNCGFFLMTSAIFAKWCKNNCEHRFAFFCTAVQVLFWNRFCSNGVLQQKIEKKIFCQTTYFSLLLQNFTYVALGTKNESLLENNLKSARKFLFQKLRSNLCSEIFAFVK